MYLCEYMSVGAGAHNCSPVDVTGGCQVSFSVTLSLFETECLPEPGVVREVSSAKPTSSHHPPVSTTHGDGITGAQGIQLVAWVIRYKRKPS